MFWWLVAYYSDMGPPASTIQTHVLLLRFFPHAAKSIAATATPVGCTARRGQPRHLSSWSESSPAPSFPSRCRSSTEASCSPSPPSHSSPRRDPSVPPSALCTDIIITCSLLCASIDSSVVHRPANSSPNHLVLCARLD